MPADDLSDVIFGRTTIPHQPRRCPNKAALCMLCDRVTEPGAIRALPCRAGMLRKFCKRSESGLSAGRLRPCFQSMEGDGFAPRLSLRQLQGREPLRRVKSSCASGGSK